MPENDVVAMPPTDLFPSPMALIKDILKSLLHPTDPELAGPAAVLKSSREILEAGGEELALGYLDGVLNAPMSYRDGAIIQLAFGCSTTEVFDHTHRAGTKWAHGQTQSGRSASRELGSVLEAHHIPCVADAFQNIGKNTLALARGNLAAFDGLMHWANGAAWTLRLPALNYLLAAAAGTARSISPMPEVLTARLTFAACARLVRDLLSEGSGGAYEQYTAAAAIEALLGEWGVSGIGGIRVATKRLNASDASSGTAGDVEILNRNRVEEAFEATANDWRTKVGQASAVVRGRGLARAHILANADLEDVLSNLEILEAATGDVSVIDLRGFVVTAIAMLRVPGRERFLRQLYDYLASMVSDVAVVNRYVRLLVAGGLTTIQPP